MTNKTKHIYGFGLFQLDQEEHLLRRADKVIALPPKAFDLLVAFSGGAQLDDEGSDILLLEGLPLN